MIKNNNNVHRDKLLSSSLTSMAEILVRQGLRVPGLLTWQWEATLFFPFSSGTGVAVKGIPW